MGRRLTIANRSCTACTDIASCRQWLGQCEQEMQHCKECALLMILLHRAIKTLQPCLTATCRLNLVSLGLQKARLCPERHLSWVPR